MFEFKVAVGPGELKFNARSLEEIYLLLNKLGVLGDKDLFEKMESVDRLGIPSVCPVDGSPVKLVMREAGSGARKFIAYEVISTGSHRFRMSLGSFADPTEGKELFIREADGWTYWDREREEQRIVFQYGRIIYANLPDGFEVPAEQAALYPDGDVITKDDKGGGQQSAAPRKAPANTGSRDTKAQVYLLELAERAGLPRSQAWKAYSVTLSDDSITGNNSLAVAHAEEVYAAANEDEAAYFEVLQSALEYANEGVAVPDSQSRPF